MPPKIRILLLGPLPPPYSGPEIMTEALVAGLRGADAFEICHLNTQVSRTLAEKGGRNQLRKSFAGLAQAARAVWMLLTFKPQVVYLPLTNSPSFLGFLRDSTFMVPALAAQCRLAMRLHGGFYYYAHARGLRRRWVAALLRRVSLAMVQSDHLRECFQGLVPAERIVVVPNGLDRQPFVEAHRRQALGAGHARPRQILFVGLLVKEKGYRDVLAAVPLVPDAHFVFAGEWPSPREQRDVEAWVEAHGLAERVHFVGVVTGPAKHDLFAGSAAFVFPSYYRYEGHAVSSVEALAAGLPIVCTQHGALDESVRDGWNGFFVPPSNPEAIAHCLNQLLGDDALRRQMAQRSLQLYEERFTLPAFIENWSRAIRRVAPSSPSFE